MTNKIKNINYNQNNQNLLIRNMLMNRIIARRHFSVINKVRQTYNLKKGTLNRPAMKSYLIDDFVGQATY